MSRAGDAFIDLLNRGQAEAALRHLGVHPELTDVTTTEGYDCLSAAAKLVDSEALVQAFFQKSAVWPDEKGKVDSLITEAAAAAHPQSLRVLLRHASGVSEEEYAKALYAAVSEESEGKTNGDTYRKAYECAAQLAEAGALKARMSEGRTVMEHELYHPPPYKSAGWERRMCYLMRLGADIKPWLETKNKTAHEERQDCIPAAVRDIESIVAEAQKRLTSGMKMTPEELLEAFRTAPGRALPARLKPKEARSLRGELYTLLSADRAEVLLAPGYWKRHGGSAAMLGFLRELNALIPDHLADLRGRFDCAAPCREAATPREGSVTVSYARGGGVEAGRV